ncbi:MAG: hypothetical protein KAR06_00690, partial [Deltaproteobacteria bacterium]|nr:hypothetical protein [Deltaproteobacteria bacterium]
LKAAQKEAARLDEEAAIAEENERQRIQDEAEEEAKVNAAVDETDADGQPNPPESEEGTDGTDEEVEEAKKKNVKKSRNRMVEPKNAKTK